MYNTVIGGPHWLHYEAEKERVWDMARRFTWSVITQTSLSGAWKERVWDLESWDIDRKVDFKSSHKNRLLVWSVERASLWYGILGYRQEDWLQVMKEKLIPCAPAPSIIPSYFILIKVILFCVWNTDTEDFSVLDLGIVGHLTTPSQVIGLIRTAKLQRISTSFNIYLFKRYPWYSLIPDTGAWVF